MPVDFLDSRYQNITPLASGGMGDVYRAYDKNLAINVAIKTLGKPTREGVVRFQQEARAYSKLKHPNLVKVFDFGVDPSATPYLVMEYITGTNLRDLIRDPEKNLSQRDGKFWLAIFRQISAAMDQAHRSGVIHRDLKPSNVIVTAIDTKTPQAKIIDFGLVKFTEGSQAESGQLTQPSNIVGSPLYLSPEQAQSETADERSDIYSLGCLMYECLAGRPPLKGETALETIAKHISEEPEDIQKLNPNVSEQLQKIIHKCLEKDPKKRFQSMKELLTALDAAHDALSDAPADNVEDDEHSRRLKKLPIVVGCVAALVLIVSGTAAIKRIRDDQTAAHQTALKKAIKKLAVKFTTHTKEGRLVAEPLPADNNVSSAGTINDEDLKQLKDTGAVAVDLSGLQIDGSGIRYFANPTIKAIDLSYTFTNDDTVAFLLPCKDIEEISLEKTPITLAGLKKLAPLRHIRKLHLSNDPLGDDGVTFMKETWPALEVLTYASAKVTPKGVKMLATFPNLRTLAVSDAKLTDDDIEPLTKMNLTELYLNENFITDKSMQRFSAMPHLRNLTIHECKKISDAAIRKFQTERPKCHVGSDLAATESYGTTEFKNWYDAESDIDRQVPEAQGNE